MPNVPGPRGPISYSRDKHGFPTIKPRDFLDGCFARGYLHATDRLAQVRLGVALAEGRALALLGDVPLARAIDRSAHLHAFCGDVDAQVDAMTPATREMVEHYCDGFDAGAKARGWPILLRLAGIKPQAYRPRDMVKLYRMLCWFGLSSLMEWPEAVITQLVAKDAPRPLLELLLGDAAAPGELDRMPKIAWPDEHDPFVAAAAGGSNAVVVSAARSTTGGALLMADPHMEIARIPPVLYATHTEYPDGDYVQGLGVAGLAWPSFGRTPRVGWTYTFAHVDVMDTLAVKCRRGEAWDGGAWKKLARREVNVAVRGKKAERWVFWDCDLGTAFGPAGGDEEVVLPMIRWAGLGDAAGDFDALRMVTLAGNVDELVATQKRISGLSLFALCADAGGRVAYVMTGRMDQRPDDVGGVLPREPHGTPEPVPDSARPQSVDPPEGFVVSANERRDGPGGERWIPLPEPRYRHERLTELVGTGPALGLDELARYAYDAVDAGARRLLPIWERLLPDDERAKKLVRWSAAQPGHRDEHYSQLALWQALHHEVCRALFVRHAGEKEADRLVYALNAIFLFHHHLDDALALERPDTLDEETLRALLATAFPRALNRAAHPDARLPHTERHLNALFAGKLPKLLGFDAHARAFPGGATTPCQSRVLVLIGQRAVFGSAARYVADMSKPGGWYCIPGGASERRFGPGYRAGIDDWLAGNFAPIGPAQGEPPAGGATNE